MKWSNPDEHAKLAASQAGWCAVPPTLSKRRGCRYWLKLLIVGAIGGLVIGYVGYVIVAAEMYAQPARVSLGGITPRDKGLSYEDVTLTTADGLSLQGWYLPSRNRAAIILLHGYGGNRLEVLDRAALLAQHDYGVLLYDERGSGESGGDQRTFGWLDVNDVSLALAYLQARAEIDPQRIGLLGFSIGGQIALRAAAQSDHVKVVVAEEPGFARISDVPDLPGLMDNFYDVSYWIGERWLSLRTGAPIPTGVVDELKRMTPRPILFTATGQDYGRALVRYFYEQAADPKEWWEVPETDHGNSLRARPQEYEHIVIDFLDRGLVK
ncbi:MAG TPA: alpha/beta fold hydrolase [Anaerolineae bacterium]|nr:alpha/beta fold hydrolase [Anaerolineae bacterium]